jgi:hypothetical protein|tara:strand:- start:192 stop:500 length:309 start_codon:yes stop_codon:yes gene_type:complete
VVRKNFIIFVPRLNKNIINLLKNKEMAKKRKLNSNNPRYNTSEDSAPKVLKKKLMCNAKVRDASGNVVKGITVPVYGVWNESDPIKGTKEKKWWKLDKVQSN